MYIMKNWSIVSYLLFALVTITFAGCSDDDNDGPSLAEQQLQTLQGTWAVTSDADVIFQEGPGAPGDWSTFRITFRDNGQVITEGVPTEVNIFELNNFLIEGENVNDFRLVFNGSDTETASVRITNDRLQLTFRLSSNDDILGARIMAIEGEWDFTLQKVE